MRSFSFKAKNIGEERYLTYTMGEGTELDEDVLNYCEDNEIKELVRIIYEEDDDFDYLTYDITGKMSIEAMQKGIVRKEQVLKIIRNIALSIINCKEQAIRLSYLLLNRGFIYVDPDSLDVQFICVPVESEASVATEFKGFIRQFIASGQYNIEEDLSYVGQLLTYINGDGFNLRGIIGLTEALMEDAGIDFTADEGAIATGEGEEVVTSTAAQTETINSVMENLGSVDGPLPEIGDDEDEALDEEEEDVSDIDPADIPIPTVNTSVEEENDDIELEDAVEETEVKEETVSQPSETLTSNRYSLVNDTEDEDSEEDEVDEVDEPRMDTETQAAIEARIKALVNGDSKFGQGEDLDKEEVKTKHEKPELKQKIKINRAAIIQNAAQQEQEIQDVTGDKTATHILSQDDETAEEKVEVTETAEGIDETSEETTDAENTVTAEEEAAEVKPVKVTSLTGREGAIKVNPYLVRETTQEKTIINKNVFKIGKANRGVDYHISGNGAISRQQAVITKKDDGYYIKDNKSTNHTYVNGKKLEDGEELKLHNGDSVRFADDEYIFKY